MGTKEVKIEIPWRVREWFPDLDEKTHLRLQIYFEQLKKFNEHINLISPKSLENTDMVHFADSILASRLVHSHIKGKPVADIGSGNGFPGLVYAILYNEEKVVLIESDTRKAEFLKHIVHEVRLSNVEISVNRVENLPAGSINCAITRGFASLTNTLLKTRKVVGDDGLIYHLKGDIWAKELAEIPSQVCSVWQPSLLGEYVLPESGIRFAVVRTQKTGS